MLQLGAATKIYLAAGATDMRKSFDTLCGVVHSWYERSENAKSEESPLDPLSGHLFVFCNRRRDRIKILFFDGSGLVLVAKRLERDSFSWPSSSKRMSRSRDRQSM